MVYLLLVNYCRKMSTRKCSKCGETKAVEEFSWRIKAKGKRQSKCKVCDKQCYQANREAVRAQQREHYEANREAILAQKQQYYEENRDEINAQRQQYRQDNREAINAQRRTPEARAHRNALRNARNATEEGKLLKKTRDLHHKFYKGIKLGPVTTQRGEALVGCTRKDYRDHLASMFKDGMTFENYGHGSDKWEIDHIIPINAFKGELEANLQMIYWWGNTQPLLGPENNAKGDSYTEEGKQDLITNYQAWVTAGKPPPVH